MPKIIHFRKNCIGCGSCVEHSKNNWKMSELDGKADLIDSTQKRNDTYTLKITEQEVNDNLMACKGCPVKIIKIVDDKGKEII